MCVLQVTPVYNATKRSVMHFTRACRHRTHSSQHFCIAFVQPSLTPRCEMGLEAGVLEDRWLLKVV